VAGLTWLALLAGARTAAATDNVSYNGGPVAHSMSGVIVDWGSSINSVYTNDTTGDPALIRYLASQSGSTGDIGGVVAQYMDSSGHNAANQVAYGGQYQITPSTTATTLMDSQIQSELVNQVQAGHLPHPAGTGLSTIYLVLFPNGDTECISSTECSANAPDPSTQVFCAYHSGTSLPDGTALLYAVLPDNTTGNMSQWCGSASSVFADQTSYLSHEWSETISDPLGTAWTVNNAASPDYGNEIGDNCNQLMTAEGGWTVQLEWSNLDHNCVGGESAYSAPTASFLSPDVAQPGQPVNADASSSSDPSADTTAISGTSYSIGSGIAQYSWTWGDGTSSGSATPTATHSYGATGNYQVSLTVTDNLGFTSTVTRAVAINTTGTLNPVPTTGMPANVSDTTATLEGTINPENSSVQYRFDYGSSPAALTQSTPLSSGPVGATPSSVSAPVSGLSPSSLYYYRLDAISGSQTFPGAVRSFTTTATPAPPQAPPPTTGGPTGLPLPSASTGGATAVRSNSATVSGTVNPDGLPTSYHVEFGTTAAYGHSTPAVPAGAAGVGLSVTATLSGLSPRTVYHYRLVATSFGGTSVGDERTFRTAAPLASAPRFSFAIPSRVALRVALSGQLRVRFRCSRACTAHFVVTVAPAHGARLAPVAITLAGGVGRIAHSGAGSATLRFLAGVRQRLSARHPVGLVVLGYAVSGGSARTAPTARRLVLS
jgi:hypothetical protein